MHLLLSFAQFGTLLTAERKSIVSLVPLTEGSSVNNNNGVLDQSLGSNQLIVATSDSDGVDTLGPQLGHGRWPGHLELPLLPDWASFASRGTTLMPMVS